MYDLAPSESPHTVALLRILGSLYPNGDHQLVSFLYGAPGTPLWQRRLGAEIFVREHQYIEALVFLRRVGAPFLRDISLGSLRSMTTNFVTEHYAYICEGRLTLLPDISLAEQISPSAIEALSHALSRSPLFDPKSEVTLYPMVPIEVVHPFKSDHFALANSSSLSASLEGFGFCPPNLLPDQFPPIKGGLGIPHPTSNWLCVNAPDQLVARKRACAILGALALAAIRRERYLQTGRSVHGGYCTISTEGYSCSPGSEPMTPRMPSNINITETDHPWLGTLSALFDSAALTQKSQVRALEYFYRAWFDPPRERFPTLCMALDSLVAAQRSHSSAAVAFVKSTIDESIDQDRLRRLMRLRGAVVHGAAPDVYESEHYEAYYSQYSEDPICDLELLVARCLRQNIFQGRLSVHADPHAEMIKKQQELGRLPRNLRGRSIIEDE